MSSFNWRRQLQKRYAQFTRQLRPTGRGAFDAQLGVEALEVRLVPAVNFVKDINPGPASSNPNAMVNADGILFFAADDGTHGDQLWQSDGTSAGTTMVADINPNGSSNPQDLTAVGGNVFFSANDGVHGSQLWMYDSSTQTVAMVSTINPSGSANPQNITAFGSQVIFSATDGVHGQELWISDGTSANTQMVSDINPGAASSSPADLTVFNSGIYFSADDGTHGRELWKTDGTSADTVLVDDIIPGSGSSNPNQLTPVGATLYFVATTPGAGTELWQSDGDSSTQMTADIQPGTGSSNPTDLTNIEDQSLFFAANDGVNGNELWRSVGGSNTASMVADINPGSAGSNPAAITDDFGTVLFIADDGTHGAQLWTSTGSDAEMVALINPNGDAFQRLPGNQFAGPTVLSNGLLVFSANDGVHGFEPWISDGTSSGTFMAQDINPGSASSFPLEFTDVFGTVYFTANDGSTGFELYTVSANARTSIPINFTINPDTSTVGQSVTMTVSVPATPDAPLPTGTVVFTDGGSTIFGTATFNAGVATSNTGALPAGFNNVFANYEGDGNYQPAQAFATESVDPGTSTPTTTSIQGDPNPSTVGQPVTFQANVTFVAGTIGGVVDFFDGSNRLGSKLVDGNGNASFTDSSLSAGDHTITVLYEGTTDFESSAANFTQTVNPGPVATTSTNVSGNPNSSTLNQPVTLTATVTTGSGTPSGVVQFVTGTTTLGSAPLDPSGTATLTLSNLPAGAISIAAIYGGSPQALPSSNSFTQQVNQSVIATTTTVSGAPNPSTVGQTVTFTATVTSTSGTPTGSVDFSEGATDLGSVTLDGSGHATKQISTLALGSHTITATFVANSSFATSSNTTPQVVNSAPPQSTTTTVTGAPNPSTAGQSVTFTATVTAGSGTPTGSVDFSEGTTDFGTVTLDGSGHATKQISTLAAGPHTITATFIANASFLTSSNTTPQVVNPAPPQSTSTTVSGTPNPSTAGQSVTFTATVTTGSGTPTGSVDFSEGTTDFGTVTLDANGQATKQISTLAAGSHTITATFIANASFLTSSNTIPQVVNPAPPQSTTTTVSGTPNPSTAGQTVTFTATVTTGSGTPSGSVDFSEGTTDFGTVTLDANGQATKQISTLAAGSYTITATFIANASFLTSSNTTPQVVNPAAPQPTSTTVSGTPNPSTAGQSVTFTATVTTGSGVPTGSVDFTEGTTDFGTVTLDANGQATKQISTLALGSHTITATFIGNTSFATSSNTTPQVVNSPTAVATSTTVSGTPNPSTTGQTVTFTATVTSGSGTPTGSVDFSEGTTDFGTVTLDGNGQATKQISTLALGLHTITATFVGNTSFGTSSKTTPQVVNSPTAVATSTTVSGTPNPSAVGQTVTFTAVVTSGSGTPTGSVDFSEGTTDFGTVTLDGNGQATKQISTLALGSHTITATFMGNTSFAISSSTTPQVVTSPTITTTTTVVAGSPNPSTVGQTVTFTATVTSGAGTPTGSVDFSEGTTDFGTATLDGNGQATKQISSLVLGSHTITATYLGSTNFAASSRTTNQVVNSPTAVTTTTTVAGSPNPSTVGQTVTFAVTVTSSSGVPSGSVDFTEGATDFGTVTLNGSGQATIQISSLAAGSNTITATFMGNTDFATSSGTTPQVVNPVTSVTTSTTLSISPNPSNAGQVVTFTAGVSAATGQPTGQVVFSEGSTNLGTATLNAAGQASIQISTLAVGPHNITATYQANASFSSSSNTQSVTVQNSGGSPNVLFVTQLYHDLLQRSPDQQGLDSWVQLIVTGTDRAVVAYDIQQSPEYLTRIINSVYAATLLRAPDPLGFANSVQFLKSGDSSRQLQALLQASNEYFVVRGGNTEAGFLNAIYFDSLGRPPEAEAQATVVPLLNAGYSRLTLATSVATSPEADARFVSTVYTLFLGRPVDAPSLQIWIDFLVRGGHDTQVVAGIMGSDEYFARAQNM